ncbi:MAG: 4Fe-4S binding protein [Clostridiales bacterium]|jgi:Fe-S-cluster-containing hydrogenase component 2|nr:4Fe-4S binding protein [Bacillota bacterium]NLK03295.1 4Fe-4S binding protein [Clostridiales bacterium]
MTRQIIKINEELCVGCGLCVNACNEGAIGLVDGKAKLLRDDYCDGLGNCLPVCPTGAISFETREALPFNKEEVKKKEERKKKEEAQQSFSGCPGSRMMTINTEEKQDSQAIRQASPSMLRQWPVQLQLVSINAPYLSNADLLIAADCTAFSFGDFHSFMKDKVTLIGCPKLDDTDYSEKLANILKSNKINSITVIRMEVPCCGGIVGAVKDAIIKSGELVPWRVVTLSTDGKIISDTK